MRILPVRTALLSVYDKQGIVELARALTERGVTILSTGGTAAVLDEADVPIERVETVTGQAEILGGRVKTLHPVIHAGILARRDVPEDMALLERDGIRPIDLVVVNLYPFEATVATDPDDLAAAIEKIDIGGPTMIRAAAKNHRDVTVVVDPEDYPRLLAALAEHDGVPEALAAELAVKAFRWTSAYDAAITAYLTERRELPWIAERFAAGGPLQRALRYGENPHQGAGFYAVGRPRGWAAAQVHQGKALSYNNLLDLDAALRCVLEFSEPAAVVVKHTNPCGVALGADLAEAYRLAREVDPVSAFGSVVGLNRPLDLATAEEIAAGFVECVVAPAIEPPAAERLAKKKNLRLVTLDPWPERWPQPWEVRAIAGGLLVQEPDVAPDDPESWRVVTRREPTPEEWRALRFAWKVVRHVKSNAIVYAVAGRVLGVGAGQMSRVDASKLAVLKARESLAGSVVASDAFFPFRDGVDAAAEAGATAVIQPGGSIRDEEVIAAADEHGMAMVFTGRRHFRH